MPRNVPCCCYLLVKGFTRPWWNNGANLLWKFPAHLPNDGSPAFAFSIPAVILIAIPCSHPLIIADIARKRGPELLGLLQFLLDISNLNEREREKKKHLCKNPKLPNRCAFRSCQKYLQSLSVVWREKCRFWLGQKFVQVFPNHFVVFVYLLVLFTYWSPQYFYVKCIKSPKELIN